MSASKVFLRVNRVASDVCAAAREVTVADLHEGTGPLGYVGLMSARMRAIAAGQRIVGPAVTAFCAPGDNLMMHRALYLAQPGDVLVVVCQAEDSAAQWGDIAARYAQHKGLAGVVVQGCVRDVDSLRSMRFPVWATLVRPVHANKKGPGSVNVPLVCGGVTVRPGDLVAADGDGVLVVPREQAAGVVAAAQARMGREERVVAGILAGTALWDLTGVANAYAGIEVDEIDRAFDDAGD